MTGSIAIERQEDGVVTLWLNRPEVKNALNAELIQGFSQQLNLLSQDKSVRVLVLRGKGSHFCSGADLQWMRDSANQSHDANVEDAEQLASLLESLDRFPTPTIAYIHGGAFGGAVGLVACCDVVLSDPQAIFSFSEVKLGLAPAMISPYVLKRMGPHSVRRYFLTAEQFNGELAQKLGLVHELASPEQTQKWIDYFVGQFLAAGPEALKVTKDLLHQLEATPDAEKLKLATECIADIRQGKEAQAGMKAFFEKKLPPWRKGDV